MIIFKSSDRKKQQQIMRNDFKESKNLDHRVVMEIFDEFYKSNLIKLNQKNNIQSLIIAGDSDEIVSLNSIEKLADSLVNCKVKIMENSGHLVPLEHPKVVAEIIKHWLTVT